MKRVWRLSIILLLLVIFALALSLAIVSADRGINWTGQFYNCIDLSCSVVETEVYAGGLNFDWSGKPEDDGGTELGTVDANGFSVRFTSTQTFSSGTYEFQITANDGIRLYIDGVLVLDDFTTNDLSTYTLSQSITAGDHSLTVEFFNDDGDANLDVQWFLTASETSTPAPTLTPIVVNASVVRVNGLSLRTGPYLGASLIGVLRPGNTYNLAAKNNSEGLFTWYYLTTDSGYSGWASGRYLELTNEDTILAEVSTDFDIASGEPDRGVIAVPRAIMNVRVRPSVRTARLTQMPWGGEAQVLARTVQGGKDFWYLVRYEGTIGWIYAPFVGIRGDINLIPVY